MAEYYYYDSHGGKYCTTTSTTAMEVTSGADLMEHIESGGDHTVSNSNRFKQRTLGIGPMGNGRGNG